MFGDEVLECVTCALLDANSTTLPVPTLEDVAEAAVIVCQTFVESLQYAQQEFFLQIQREVDQIAFNICGNIPILSSKALLEYDMSRVKFLADFQRRKERNEDQWERFRTNVSRLVSQP